MVYKSSSSDVGPANPMRESISDEKLLRGFLLALAAGGRKEKTLQIYEESIRMLSECWQPAKVGHSRKGEIR